QSCLKNECHAALGITTISFDMSVWETGSPLMHGKTLVFVGDDDCNDPNRLAMLISDYGVDCMTATTSRFMQLLESPAFEEVFSKQIHLAYQGGEGLSVALLHKLQSYPNVRIFNGYGPTETIANSHASELTHDTVAHIGKPCVNYTNFIIDNDGNELPVGVVGELVIGGRSVAKGYNNLPEQTASRFVEYQGQRVYKSGDYARWMPDGNVVLLGRKDNQVKLRGLRIELGEVESAITKVEGVKNVTVMIKKLAGKDHLCAYFTADRPIAIDDMKEEISKTLTHYMVPTAYLQMEAFPLTPNGKTDVKNLPEPELAKVGGDYVAPNNATEADFCDIFGMILELDKVSVVDSFFDLGGSSLTATRVVIEATNKGYQVSYAEVFDNPTPRKLARLVSGGSAEDSVDQEVVDYDYTAIDNILAENNLDSFLNGERLELGDVILTGANGYLGIHILRDLLENHIKQHPENKVYCLVRHGRNGVTSKARLRNLLFY
ncbi:MAG: AMP-binding protein, partial [Prevotella sp.]|nr:AMP-binding protein [Prevotella sp.]